MGICSSAIVTKLVVELRRLANRETALILGVSVVQDVFLALYLALLQPVLGGAQDAAEALMLFVRAFAFLLVLFAIARYGSRLTGRLVGSPEDEPLTVIFVGLGILIAGIAAELGVSEAIGALMVGLILAETDVADRIKRLILPLRDAFAAVFFFTFGLSIDPNDIGSVAGPVAAAVAVTAALSLASGVLAVRIYGFGRREAANVGLTLLGRGEFSLILATFATAAGLDSRIGPFVALYVLVLAIAAPLLASRPRVVETFLPVRRSR
jgi:CPA2 family monovalent cation:H+ antiporter-2